MTGDSSVLGNHPRGVPITLELATKLSETAWSSAPGVTASDIVREALSDILESTGKLPDDPGSGPRRLAFYIHDDEWEKLRVLAHQNRVSRAALVRGAIARKLG